MRRPFQSAAARLRLRLPPHNPKFGRFDQRKPGNCGGPGTGCASWLDQDGGGGRFCPIHFSPLISPMRIVFISSMAAYPWGAARNSGARRQQGWRDRATRWWHRHPLADPFAEGDGT